MPRIGPMFCRNCGKEAKNPQGFNGKHEVCQECFGLSMRKRVEVNCLYCGKGYELRAKESEYRGRFCNAECYHAAARGVTRPTTTTIAKTCPECKETFEVPQSQKARTYCTRRCAYKARTKPKPACIDCGVQLKFLGSKRCMSCAGKYRMPPAKEPIMNCLQCGKVSRSKTGFYNGMCRKCAAVVSNQKRQRRIAVVCPICQQPFEIQRHKAMASNNNFCSKECCNIWKRAFRVGRPSYGWQGGKKYYGPNWQKQRSNCRKRANYRCEECGKPQSENRTALHVHHKIPFRTFGYIPDQNDNYLLANDLSNLIAACESCHVTLEYKAREMYPLHH